MVKVHHHLWIRTYALSLWVKYINIYPGVDIYSSMYLSSTGTLKPTAMFLDCHHAVNVLIATIQPLLQMIKFH